MNAERRAYNLIGLRVTIYSPALGFPKNETIRD